jgi:hypothetical protein
MKTNVSSFVTKLKSFRLGPLGAPAKISIYKILILIALFTLTPFTAIAQGPWDPDADRDLPEGFKESPPPELYANLALPVFVIVLIVMLYQANREKLDLGNSIFILLLGAPVLTGIILMPVYLVGCVWEMF